jgi:short subunit dehydrogenase-like uncharacterized protein
MPTTAPTWILGATGRVGSGVARALSAEGRPLVLTGRSEDRLRALADTLPGPVVLRPGLFEDTLHRLSRERPAVVVNTVGPFVDTAPRVIAVLGHGVHYVDVSNELPAVRAVLDAADRAREHDAAYVAAAGFGILGTESAVHAAMAAAPELGAPAAVRVDAIASVAGVEGVVGEALANSIVGGIGSPGNEVHDGALTTARIGGRPERVETPDGDVVTTGSFPSGDLLGAWHGSGAREVVAANAFAPTGTLARIAIPALGLIGRIPGVVPFLAAHVAARPTHASPAPRAHSWARARLTWADGTTRTTWFRAGEGMDFTVAAVAETARRLADGTGRAGGWTPAALFGHGIAESAGAAFVAG